MYSGCRADDVGAAAIGRSRGGRIRLDLPPQRQQRLDQRAGGNLTSVDAGFSTDKVVTFHVGARWDEDRTKVGQFQTSLLDALDRTPGVTAAGFANFLPMSGAPTIASFVPIPSAHANTAGTAHHFDFHARIAQ